MTKLHLFACLMSVFFIFNISRLNISCEVIRLNRNNFEETIFHDNDPWIIGIRSQISEEELDEIYEQVKDRINLGSIDEKEYIQYLTDIDAPARSVVLDKIRVYPFGAKIHKQREWENAGTTKQAIKKALSSIPDVTVLLPSTVDQKNEMLRDFIQTSYAYLPPKFPVVLFTGEKSTPMYYKLISLKFSTLFHFGLIRNPPPSTMAVYTISKLPHLAVLLTEVLKDGTPRIKPVHYADEIHGALDYPRVLRFLYLVHMKFFKELPGSSHATTHDIDEIFGPHITLFPELLRLPEGAEKEAMANKLLPSSDQNGQSKQNMDSSSKEPCNDSLDICIIVIGRDLGVSESNIIELESIKANLSRIKQKLIQRGKSVEVHQLDISCNEESEIEFDIYAEDVPVLLLLRPKKHLFTVAVINELPITIESYLEKALGGKIGHRKYDKLPELKIGHCNGNENVDDASNLNMKTEL